MSIVARRRRILIPAASSLLLASVALAAGARAQADPPALPAPVTVPIEGAQALQTPPIRFESHPVVQPLPPAPDQLAAGQAASLHALVENTPLPLSLDRDLHCLASAVYHEARGESLSGQLAVARVIINRSRDHRFPSSYCGVVLQPGQFSFVRSRQLPAPRANSPAWQRARAIALIAHRDLWASEAGDALFFHAVHARPGWAGRKTARATIDQHIFYR